MQCQCVTVILSVHPIPAASASFGIFSEKHRLLASTPAIMNLETLGWGPPSVLCQAHQVSLKYTGNLGNTHLTHTHTQIEPIRPNYIFKEDISTGIFFSRRIQSRIICVTLNAGCFTG